MDMIHIISKCLANNGGDRGKCCFMVAAARMGTNGSPVVKCAIVSHVSSNGTVLSALSLTTKRQAEDYAVR